MCIFVLVFFGGLVLGCMGFWFVVCLFFFNLGGFLGFFAFSFSHFKDVNALSCVEKVKVGPSCHLILYSRGVHLNLDL